MITFILSKDDKLTHVTGRITHKNTLEFDPHFIAMGATSSEETGKQKRK
jgi:hypothetical protein